jgi:hypothetical protein
MNGSGSPISKSENSGIVPAKSVPADASFIVLHDYPPPELERLWREFLSRIDSPAHYEAPEYFLEPYWAGKRPFAVLALDRDRVIGTLTGLHLGGRIVCGVPSRPQIRIDGADDPLLASEKLVEGLFHEARREPLITVFSWKWLPLPGFEQRGFLRRELEGDVVLDLSIGTDRVFKQFHQSRRRNIRLAIRHGIEVREATTSDDTAAYWQLYSAWRSTERKVIRHKHTLATIETIHGMRTNHRRFLARYKGQVIAATGLRFLSGGLVENANNCSLDEFLHLHPNDLLTWRTIEWACENGFSKYSMGGAHPFHRRSGGNLVPICRYRLDRSFLHRHDLKESLSAKARFFFDRAPEGVGHIIRNLFGKR